MNSTPEILSFFKESDSNLGIFYPTHYILVTFPNESSPGEAEKALRETGVSSEQILILKGDEMARFLEEHRAQAGVGGKMMTGVSRFLGDDATFVDDDIERGRKGFGFLFVYCATSEDSQRLRTVLLPYQPHAMHWYMNEGIQELS